MMKQTREEALLDQDLDEFTMEKMLQAPKKEKRIEVIHDNEDDIELALYQKMKSETTSEYTAKIYPDHSAAIAERLADLIVPDLEWIETLTITSNTVTAEKIVNAEDDLQRELAFYQQSLDAVLQAKQRFLAANVPFDRPTDYFAEMLKSDEHMAKIRQRLVDEAVGMKASEEARKQRDLKKFGKKLQQEKLLERQASKRDALDKIKLVRKRGASRANAEGEDDFDVQLEEAEKSSKKRSAPEDQKGRKRQRKDEKFGFGGKKKFIKSNTSESTNDISSYNHKTMKGSSGKSTGKSFGGKPSGKSFGGKPSGGKSFGGKPSGKFGGKPGGKRH